MNFYIINGVLEVHKMFYFIFFAKKSKFKFLRLKNLNLDFSILEISWRIKKDNRRTICFLPKFKK